MAFNDYLMKKHNTYYAVLTVPQEARSAIGKTRFRRSLQTDSLTKANVMKLPYVAEWKRRIGLALKGQMDPRAKVMEAALAFQVARLADDTQRMEFRDQESTNEDELLSQIDEEAKRVEEEHGLEASRQFRAVAKGKEAFVNDTYPAWLAQCTDAPQTKAQHLSTVKRFIAWAPLATVKLPRKKAGEYINELLTTSGKERRTIERYAASLSSLWRWYIARGT